MTTTGRPRRGTCRHCHEQGTAGRLIRGVCPRCLALKPLLLRGERGRFIRIRKAA